MSRFEPVKLPEGRGLNDRASQTFLRHFNGCPRSAFLYQAFKGEASTPEMQRGSAIHAIHERAVRAMIDADERTIPPELVKAIANEVLADPGLHVPFEEQDYVREMAFRLAEELKVEPGAVIACETLFVLELAGWQVRCRIDFAELWDDGATVYVADLKSAKGAPGYEEIARKRSDGSLAAKSFQLVLYALVLAYGVPVREEECPECEGTGSPYGHGVFACDACDGKGRIETTEAVPTATRAQRFDLEFTYPGIEDREGNIVRRPVSLTRLELEEYRASLTGLLERLRHSEQTGDWPAVASDSACSECPAPALCPIPAELRDHRGTINTLEEASEAAEVLYREKAVHAARQKELREWAKAHGVAVPFGRDMEWRFSYSESEVIRDKAGMFDAFERARLYGEDFDRSKFVKAQGKTDFRPVQLSVEELEQRQRQEAPVVDGEPGERWGDEVPF